MMRQKRYPNRRERFLRHLGALLLVLALLQAACVFPLLPRWVTRFQGRVVAAGWTMVEGMGPVRGYLCDDGEDLRFRCARFLPLQGWQSCGGSAVHEENGPLSIGIGTAKRLETYSGPQGGGAWVMTTPAFLYGQVKEPRAETLRVTVYLGREGGTVTVDLPWEDWVHKNGKDYFLLPLSGGAWGTNASGGQAQLLDAGGAVLWEGSF